MHVGGTIPMVFHYNITILYCTVACSRGTRARTRGRYAYRYAVAAIIGMALQYIMYISVCHGIHLGSWQLVVGNGSRIDSGKYTRLAGIPTSLPPAIMP